MKDIIKVEVLVSSHNPWMKNEVVKGFSLGDRLYYHTVFRWDKFVVNNDLRNFGHSLGTAGTMYRAFKNISRQRLKH